MLAAHYTADAQAARISAKTMHSPGSSCVREVDSKWGACARGQPSFTSFCKRRQYSGDNWHSRASGFDGIRNPTASPSKALLGKALGVVEPENIQILRLNCRGALSCIPLAFFQLSKLSLLHVWAEWYHDALILVSRFAHPPKGVIVETRSYNKLMSPLLLHCRWGWSRMLVSLAFVRVISFVRVVGYTQAFSSLEC